MSVTRQARYGLFGAVSLLQGGYYAITGVWPLLHMRSFELITGPKTDRWLVKTVGALVGVIGGVLLMAGMRRQRSQELLLLSAGSAAALGTVDVVYASRGRISAIYLADALVEAMLVVAGIIAWRGNHEGS